MHLSTRTKVSLRGNSKAEESREQILERTRLEREKRRRAKLENTKATIIQSHWRSWSATRKHLCNLRRQWVSESSGLLEVADICALLPQSPLLRPFLLFGDPRREDDVQILSTICRRLLSTISSSAGQVVPHLQHDDARQVAAFRIKKLAQLCLSALQHHRAAFLPALSSPKSSTSSTHHAIVSPLIEFLIAFLNPAALAPITGPQAAAATCSSVCAHLLQHHMYPALCTLLQTVAPAARLGTTSYVETLATQLTARHIALKTPNQDPAQGPQHLLFTPQLWARFPSLRPISGHISRMAVAQLARMTPQQVVDHLPAGCKARSAALLVANLIQAGPKVLQGEVASSAQSITAAAQTVHVLSVLLALLPLDRLFPAVSEQDAQRQATGLPSSSGPVAALNWQDAADGSVADVAGELAQVSEQAGKQVLQQLAQVLLPRTGPQQQPAAAFNAELYAAGWAYCCLLRQLLALPGHSSRLLLGMSVSGSLVSRLWYSMVQPAQQLLAAGADLAALVLNSGSSTAAAVAPAWQGLQDNGLLLPLLILSRSFSSFISTADIESFYEQQQPLPFSCLCGDSGTSNHGSGTGAGLVPLLNDALWRILWLDADRHPGSAAAGKLRLAVSEHCGRLLEQLYDRNCRRAFCSAAAFHADLPPDRFMAEASSSRAAAAGAGGGDGGAWLDASGRVWGVLRHAPCLVPFQERAKLLQREVEQSRQEYREMELAAQMERGLGWEGNRFVPIRRTHILYDGFDQLGRMGEGLKGRVRVQLINAHGEAEAGVDGGGLFKDFLEDLIREGFSPQYGLFRATSAQELYPDPAAVGMIPEAAALLEFLGRMLGKAMYEGILVELPLAGFFLKKFRGEYCDMNDLPSLDPEVHRHMASLRQHPGSVADLGLTFTIADSQFGAHREVELKPGGGAMAVTNDNVIEYIHRVADYRLNQQPARACQAFLRGFYDVIQPSWVRMFNERELQMLISGSTAEGLDLKDLQAHVHYQGGYHEEHPVVHNFWEALQAFSPQEQAAFLKFVTACSRPPLLGFKYLEPQMCIQMAGGVLQPGSTARLPTSATCMNLLKLPPYSSVQQMRDKLLYAVKSGAGFDLS